MIRSLPAVLLGLLLNPGALAAQEAATSLTLVDAIRLGRQQGVNAALAQVNHRVAESRQNQRRADLLPSVTLSGAASRQTNNLDEFGIPLASGVTDPFNIVKFSIRGAQTLFDASAITRLRAARDSAIASGLDARAVGDLSAATAGLAYLRALSAEETVRARESDSLVAWSLLDQATKLVAAGVSPTIDQTRSEVNFAAVRTQLELARNQRDRARLDLARALERSPTETLTLVDSLAPAQLDIPRDPAAAVAFALEHRADLVAEHNRTKAIAGSLRSIGREYIPSVGVSGGYTQSGQQLSSLKGTYLVQLGVTLPLLDGWRRPARQDEIRARLEGQQIREHDLALQVEIEARQSLLDLGSAAQQVGLANDRVRLAEQELSQAEERFAAGVAGSIETSNGQGALVAARDALIQARVNYASARVSAYRALGVIDQLQ
jgi:outer membrane protein TolC